MKLTDLIKRGLLNSGGGAPAFYNNLLAYWGMGTPYTKVSYQPDALRDFENGMYLGADVVSNVSGLNGGKACEFDNTATDSRAYVKANPDLGNFGNAGTDLPFTIRIWVYPTLQDASARFPFSRRIATGIEYQAYLSNGVLTFNCWSAGGTSVYIGFNTTGTTFPINTWSCLTITYDGSKTTGGFRCYKDGVGISITPISSGTYLGMNKVTNAIFSIAKHGYAYSSTTNTFKGRIAEVAIFDRVLTADEVLQDYDYGNYEKYSGETLKPFHFETSLIVLATRGDYVLSSDGTNLLFSEDGGKTYPNTNAWGTQDGAGNPDPIYNKKVDFAHIFDDGTIIFSCSSVMYRSTNKLSTISPVTVYEADGVTPYTIHTPADSTLPGNYFQSVSKDSEVQYLEDGTTEILLFSNYTNTVLGASPINVWYTIDKGATIRSLYEFGQNGNYKDDGTANGGTTGTSLGDAGNSTIARHTHGTFRRPGTNEWYTVTGDATAGGEVNWIKHVYDEGTDEFTNSVFLAALSGAQRYKVVGLAFDTNDNVYWVSDANDGAIATSELGIFKASMSDVQGTSERIYDPNSIYGGSRTDATDIKIVGNTIIATANYTNLLNKLMISRDLGDTWEVRELQDVVAFDDSIGQITSFNQDYFTVRCGCWAFKPFKTVWVRKAV